MNIFFYSICIDTYLLFFLNLLIWYKYSIWVQSGPSREFLEHPLLRGGFLEDAYECFDDQVLANEFMTAISNDLPSFIPLTAQRCAMSGWKPKAI